MNLWHQKFVTADVTAVFVKTINMVFSDEDKVLIKSLYLKGYTAKSLTYEFPYPHPMTQGRQHCR